MTLFPAPQRALVGSAVLTLRRDAARRRHRQSDAEEQGDAEPTHPAGREQTREHCACV